MSTRLQGGCAIVGAIAVALTMVGCALPQTRVEFVAYVRGSSWAQTSSATANRSFDLVARDLNAFAGACLNVNVHSSVAMSSSSYAYVGSFAVPRLGHGELTVQMQGGIIGAPPGGQYVFAVDVDATGPTTTQAVIYGPGMGWDDVFAAIGSVMRGELPPCPELP